MFFPNDRLTWSNRKLKKKKRNLNHRDGTHQYKYLTIKINIILKNHTGKVKLTTLKLDSSKEEKISINIQSLNNNILLNLQFNVVNSTIRPYFHKKGNPYKKSYNPSPINQPPCARFTPY